MPKLASSERRRPEWLLSAAACRLERGGRLLRSAFYVCAVLYLIPTSYISGARGLYEIREIKPNIFVWIPEDILDQDGDPQFSRAGTAGFIIFPEAVLVVNTTNSPFHARELLYEIRKRTEAPVKFAINTDSRGDHTLGNEVFLDQQASIISTATAEAEMRRYARELAERLEGDWRLQARMRGFHPALPTRTLEGEMTLLVSGEEIRLLNFGRGRQAANTAVYLPHAKVLFLGDLYENEFFPRMGTPDVHRWIEILREAEGWDVDWYVPGHGPPTNKKGLAEFRGFLEWLTKEVGVRIQQGKSLEQVKNDLMPLENYRWHAPELAPGAVESVYRQLIGERQ